MSSTAPSNTNTAPERDVPASSTASDASDGSVWDTASAQDSSSDGETPNPEPLVTEKTKQILPTGCCSALCLRRHVEASTAFLYGYIGMSKENQRLCLMTSLGISSSYQLQKVSKERERYDYMVPMVGRVCKKAFQAAFGVCNNTLTKYRGIISSNKFNVPDHKHNGNNFAQFINRDDIASWFRGYANEIGETVPIRFRHQSTVNGQIKLQYTKQNFLLLPSHLTWKQIWQIYTSTVNTQQTKVKQPSLTTFCQVLNEDCPTIKIRSPRDNVCDDCVLYRNNMGTNPTIDETEPLAQHVQDARSMRHKYTRDGNTASSTHIVTTIDFSQNIAMPHSAQTPSMWYFLSLPNISVFGIHNQPDIKQWNYVYSERKAGKGSNEVISMLDWFARSQNIYGNCIGDKSWSLYADNCGGQNKNNFMVKYLLFLTHSKAVKSISFNILIKGHTKNNCDRGFANIKRYYAKRDMWNLDMVKDTFEESATSNTCVLLENEENVFRDFKFPLQNLYKDLKGIQSYQIFTMDSSEPGKVRCQKRQSSAPVVVDLLRRKTDEVLSAGDIAEFWTSIQTATPPVVNKEKVVDLHNKILQYVPPQYRDDPLYLVPSEQEIQTIRAKKRTRRTKTEQE